jgi:uncharacterized protein (TIGR03437 family)
MHFIFGGTILLYHRFGPRIKMDAVKLSSSRIALLLSFALLIPASAFSQTPAFSLAGGANTATVTLISTLPSQVTVASSTSPTEITYQATTIYDTTNNPSGVKWLCLNPSPGVGGISCDNLSGLKTPDSLNIQVGQQAGSPFLPQMLQTATITLAPTDGSGAAAGTITVYYTPGSNGGNTNGAITSSPSSITQTVAFGSQTTVPITLQSSSATPLAFTLQPPTASWAQNFLTSASLTSGTVSAGNPATLYVTLNGSGQNPVVLNTSLFVTYGANTLSIPVTFGNGVNAGGGGGTGSIQVSPSSIAWSYSNGSNFPSPATVSVSSTAGTISFGTTVASSNGWLFVSPQTGTLPATLTINPTSNIAALSTGSYTGVININGSDGTTQSITVTLVINGGSANGLTVTPNPVSLQTPVGGATVQQAVSVTSITGGTLTASVSGTGLSQSISSNFINANVPTSAITVFGNPAGLSAGTYTGTLTVTVGNVSQSVQVNFTVGSGGGSGGLTLGTSSLMFQQAVGGAATTQQLTVSANAATAFTAGASTNNGNSTWLSVSPAGTSVTNTTLTVTANPAGLVAGTYSGQITLVTSTGTQNVPVTMIVGGGGTGNITVTANGGTSTSPSLTFTAQSVGAAVQPQYLSVTSASGSSAVSFTASLSGASCSWVALGISVGQAYQTPLNQLSVGATTTGVAAGTYNCTLSLSPTGGTAVTVPLTLTVIGQPTVTIPTTPLSFSYAAGTAVPPAQTITATGAGSAAASFTASATSTPSGWLSVSPTSGSVSSSASVPLSVSVNPSGLAAGTYNGSITVTPGTGATGGGTVPVTLTVTAPTPAITTILNGASSLAGGVSPGEFVSIMGASLGPLTPVNLALDSTGKVSTTLGNVQVFFSATPAPLTYVSSTQINCIVPYGVNGLSTVPVKVVFLSQPSNDVILNVQNSAPGIFSANATGTGQGSILNQNFIPNSAGTPAAKGSIVQIYMTGEGITSPPGTDGAITGNATTVPVLPIAVKIGGQPATVVFAGEAPGIVAGVLQVNVMIPPTVSSGANPVSVTIGSNTSQANLTVAVQ